MPKLDNSELNKYDVPKWLIEALKSYDGLMSSEKGKIKGNKMKAKRELANAIQKEVEKAKKNERRECIKAFEQKMTNLGVKWGRIHKADCECGESGCLTPSQQNKEES